MASSSQSLIDWYAQLAIEEDEGGEDLGGEQWLLDEPAPTMGDSMGDAMQIEQKNGIPVNWNNGAARAELAIGVGAMTTNGKGKDGIPTNLIRQPNLKITYLLVRVPAIKVIRINWL
ncbi:hypothetical protein LguiB_031606 [Lonicera macranthoides]